MSSLSLLLSLSPPTSSAVYPSSPSTLHSPYLRSLRLN